MAFSKQKICHLYKFLMIIMYLRNTTATNIDCDGKPFHCVNSTHFMICVDLGDGVSQTVDDYMIRCPLTTVCLRSNHFECEYRVSTTTESTIRPSDVTNESEIKIRLPSDPPSSESSPSILSNNFNTVSFNTKAGLMNDDTEQPREILDITGISTVPISDTDLQYLSTTGSYAVEEIISEVTQINTSDNIDPLRLPKLSNNNKKYIEHNPTQTSTKLEPEPSVRLLNEENINNGEAFFNNSTSSNKSTNAIFVDSFTELITKDTLYMESLSFTPSDIDKITIIDLNISTNSKNDLVNFTRSTDFEDRTETLKELTTEGIMYTKPTSTNRINLPNLTLSRTTEKDVISTISPITDFSNSNDIGKKSFEEIKTPKVLEISQKDLLLHENIAVDITNKTDIILDVTTSGPEALNKNSSFYANPMPSLIYNTSNEPINKDFQGFDSDSGYTMSTNSNYNLLNLETTTNSFRKVDSPINSVLEPLKSSRTEEIKQSTVSGTNTEASSISNTDLPYMIMAKTKEVNIASANFNYLDKLKRESNPSKLIKAIPTVENLNKSPRNLSKVLIDEESKINNISKTNSFGIIINDREPLNKNTVLYYTMYPEASGKDSTTNFQRSDDVNTITDYPLEVLSEDASGTINNTGMLQGGSIIDSGLNNYSFPDVKKSNETTNNSKGFTDTDTLNTISTIQSLDGLSTENSMDSLNNRRSFTESTTKTVLSLSDNQTKWPGEIVDITEIATNRILPASVLKNITNYLKNYSSKRKDLQGLSYKNNKNSFQSRTNPQVYTESTQEASESSLKFTNSIFHTTTKEPSHKDSHQIDFQRIDTVPTPSTLFDLLTLVTSGDSYTKGNSSTDIGDITTAAELPLHNFKPQKIENEKNIKSSEDKKHLHLPYEINDSTTFAITLEPMENLTLVPLKVPTKEYVFVSPLSFIDTMPAMHDESATMVNDSGSTNLQVDTIGFGNNGLNNKNTQDFSPAYAFEAQRESITSTSDITFPTTQETIQMNNENSVIDNNVDFTDVILSDNNYLSGTIFKLKEPTKEYLFTSTPSSIDTMTILNHESSTAVTLSSDSTLKMQKDTNQSGKDSVNIYATQNFPVNTLKGLTDSITSSSDMISVSTDETTQIIDEPLFTNNNINDTYIFVPVSSHIFSTVSKIKIKPTKEFVLTSPPSLIDIVTPLKPEEFTTTIIHSGLTKMQADTIHFGRNDIKIKSTKDFSPAYTFKALQESITSTSDITSTTTDKTAQKRNEKPLINYNVESSDFIGSDKNCSSGTIFKLKEPTKEYVYTSTTSSIDIVSALNIESSTIVTLSSDSTLKMQKNTTQVGKESLNIFAAQDLPVNKFKALPESINLSSDIISVSTDETTSIINEPLFTHNNVNDTDIVVPVNSLIFSTLSKIKTEPTKESVLTSPPSLIDTVTPSKPKESTTTITHSGSTKMQADTMHFGRNDIKIKSTQDFSPAYTFEALQESITSTSDITSMTIDKTAQKSIEKPLINSNVDSSDVIVSENNFSSGTIFKLKEPTKEYVSTSTTSSIDTVTALNIESSTIVTLSSNSTQKITTQARKEGLNILAAQDLPVNTFKALPESTKLTTGIISVSTDETTPIINEPLFTNNNINDKDIVVPVNRHIFSTLSKIKTEPSKELVLTSSPSLIDTLTPSKPEESTTTITHSGSTKMQADTMHFGRNDIKIKSTQDFSPAYTFEALQESITSSSDITSTTTDKTAQKSNEKPLINNNVESSDVIVSDNNYSSGTIFKLKEPTNEYVSTSTTSSINTVTALNIESSTIVTLSSDSTLKMQKNTTQARKESLNIFAAQDLPVNTFKALLESNKLSSDIIYVSTDETTQIIDEPLFTNNNVNDTDIVVPVKSHIFSTVSKIKTEPTKESVLTSLPSSIDTVIPLKPKESTTTITHSGSTKMKAGTIHFERNDLNIKRAQDFSTIFKLTEPTKDYVSTSTHSSVDTVATLNLESSTIVKLSSDSTSKMQKNTIQVQKESLNIFAAQDPSVNTFKALPESIKLSSDIISVSTDETTKTIDEPLFTYTNVNDKDIVVPVKSHIFSTVSKIKIEPTKESVLTSPPSLIDIVTPLKPEESKTTITLPRDSTLRRQEVMHPINLLKVNGSLPQTEHAFNGSELDSYKKKSNIVKDNISVTTILTPLKIEKLVGNLNTHIAEETFERITTARKENLQPNIPMLLENITDSSSNVNFKSPKDFKRSSCLNSSTFIDNDGLKIRIDKEFVGENSVILSKNYQKPETPRLNNNTRTSAYKMSANLSKSTVGNQDESKTKVRSIKTLSTSKENNDSYNLLYGKRNQINNSTAKHFTHVATYVSGNIRDSRNQYKKVFIAPMTNLTNINRTAQPLLKPKVLSEITSNNRQTSVNTNRSQSPVNKVQFTCVNRLRGRYANKNDCKKFYICIGQIQPLLGECPANTVFSQIKKQCTKNLSHCINNNQFDCTQEGRFIDVLKDNIYYICVKNEKYYVRFQFQCQSGYHLNKTSIKCMHNNLYKPIATSSTSIDSDSNKASDQNTVERIPQEKKKSKENSEKNICRNEGKFPDPNDCRKYYVCSKNSKSVFRRRTKKCDSDEVFHREKKKCVSDESYECH